MQNPTHRSFVLTSVLTTIAFGGAPVAHFTMVDHGSGDHDGTLKHVAPCILSHEYGDTHSSSLTKDCPAGHDADACGSAALLRSAWLPALQAMTDEDSQACVRVRAPSRPPAACPVYRLAPKASPPASA